MIPSNSFFRSAIAFILLLIVYSCTEQKLAAPSPTGQPLETNTGTTAAQAITPSLFNRHVGAPINKQQGLLWKRNFTIAKPGSAATDYVLRASTLKEILSVSTCVGISLFYAVDVSGRLMIVPVGINANGNAIAAQSISLEPVIDWQTAWKYINNYTGEIKAHFFGAETFNRLLVAQSSPAVRVSLALNNSGTPQLLLSNASVADPAVYEDQSIVCPPVCPSLN
jgi:hypothetical protein